MPLVTLAVIAYAAGLLLGFPNIDDPTLEEIEQAKQKLIEQKPLNKFYWDSEYGQMRPAFKSGTIWITYSWQAAYASFADKGMAEQADSGSRPAPTSP